MPNRREAVHQFYRSVPGGASFLEKSAANSVSFPFRGPSLSNAIVTRTDLNGYSTWARDKSAAQRAVLLDAFFSAVVPMIYTAGGVFFRDEGDCIVALFTDYFGPVSIDRVEAFSILATQLKYGAEGHTAKTTIATGPVAIFQKRHEAPTGDWSAEGDPFVRTARLEAAITTSARQILMTAADFDAHFRSTANNTPAGGTALWYPTREKMQVQGLGAVGGWIDVVRYEYRGP